MKDYKFYKLNPKLEIAFTNSELRKSPKQEKTARGVKVNSNFGLDGSISYMNSTHNFKIEDSQDLIEGSSHSSKVR